MNAPVQPAAAPPPTTLKFRLAGLAALLVAVGLGMFAYVRMSPQAFYLADWVLGENGNQLFRADQMAAGQALYRDIECQYGPLPIVLWRWFAALAGNTIPASLLFHSLLTLAFLGALYWWTTGHGAKRSLTVAMVIALGLLAFARTPLYHLGALVVSHAEYVNIERLCMLGLMALWRPPEARGRTQVLLLAGVFITWQCSKAGGVFFGLAAFGLVDLWWLAVQHAGRPWRAWLRWWAAAAAACVALELGRCGWFVAVAGMEPGLRSAWPFYVVQDYGRTWLTLWAGPKQFLAVVLPIVSPLGLLAWLAGRPLWRGRDAAGNAPSPLAMQGAVGAVFYLLGAVPGVGYFGHEWLFFQYQWALLPLMLAALRHAPAAGLGLLLLVHAGPLYLTVREIQTAPSAGTLQRLDTRSGPLCLWPGDPQGELLRAALEMRQRDATGRTLIVAGWGGGGWYVAANEPVRPRNCFFNSPVVRTAEDREEFARLLAEATLVLVRVPGASGGGSALPQRLLDTLGVNVAQRLNEQFLFTTYGEWRLYQRKPPPE